MNYSEMIADFFDGTLSSSEELRLFAALAQDTDVRTEFKEMLLIHNATKQDASAFVIPPASESAIFSRLGFAAATEAAPLAVPIAASLPSATASSSIAAQQGGMRLWGVIGAIVCAALLSSFFTTWLLRGSWGNTSESASNNGNSNNGAPPYYGASFLGSSPQPFVITDTVFRRVIIQERQAFVSAATPRQNRDWERFMNTVGQDSAKDIIEKNIADESLKQHNTPALQSIEQRTTLVEPRNSLPHIAAQTTPQTAPQALPLLGLSVSARGIVGWSMIGATRTPAPEQFPTNAAIGALYALSPQHSIGLESGRESFFQRFYTIDGSGVEYRIEQYPTLTWAGAAYRYTMLPESALSPFLHLVVGATEVGAMGRGMAGFTYAPDARTTLLLGAEVASIFYQHENTLYFSPKFNVSYGVSVRF
jgi:hypothetical protein